MNLDIARKSHRWTAVFIAAAATTAGAAPVPHPDQAMLTIPQAITIAEVTQKGSAFSLRRETEGADVVYHVKVSTPDRGIVNVHVATYGGRVLPQRHQD